MTSDGSAFVKTPATELSIDEIIAKARPVERTVELCLRGDLSARFEELERQLREARQDERAADRSLGDSTGGREIAEEMERIRNEMRESLVTFRLRAMPPKQWTALRGEHMDTNGRLDLQAFGPPAVAASLVSPQVTAAQLDALVAVLSGGQWDELVNTAVVVNQGTVDVPFSQLASLVLRPPDSDPS